MSAAIDEEAGTRTALHAKAKAYSVMAGLDLTIHPPATRSEFGEALPIGTAKAAGSSPGIATGRHRPGLDLFAEDFDTSPKAGPAAEPDIIEPTFTQTDLETARQQAWQAGHDAAAIAAAQANAAAIRETIAAIATSLADAGALAAVTAQHAADQLARLLFDSFATAFPSLCAAYGEAELRILVRTLLPALRQEPTVTIRVNPAHAAAIGREIEHADSELVGRIEILASETIQPGDIRIAWRGGKATRNAAALWTQIAEVLAPAGLVSCAATKEPERVE